nr:hypothetical protein [Gammaproteobacteria bacterium]
MDIVEIVEIDIPFCRLTYGVAPCEAELGVTGEIKCFNTRRTCQDIENFDPAPLTLRFTHPSLELDYDAIPSLESVSVTPQVADPGVSMGQRESVRVVLADHPHSDAGLDKYLAERDYDAFRRGTFWGKLRARITTLKGLPLRVRIGERGRPLEDMRTAHYLIESTEGPDGRVFSITAKDALKVADGDRAQAPAASRGQLAAAISESDFSLTLTPAGIGDIDYPSSGKACIGGSEIVTFTRSGDNITLTGRGVSNTEATSHQEGELFQLVLEYNAETVANIIYDLLITYTAADPAWIPLADWQQEVDDFIGRLYSAEIAEPTPVRDLINELIEQAGLVLWTDVYAQQIRLQALRPVPASAEIIDEERMLEGTFRQVDQPKKRISQSWTFYGQIRPTEQLDNRLGYQFAAIGVDLESEAEHNDEPAISKVFSRWITGTNRAAAERLNELKLARYAQAPRRFEFGLFRTHPVEPVIGAGIQIQHRALQDETGGQLIVPAQIISVARSRDRWGVVAEEMAFRGDIGSRTVFLDTDMWNINLRELYDQIYSAPTMYDTITFVVAEGVQIGSGPSTLINYNRTVAMRVGDWPEGPRIRIINYGNILGCGGNGRDARIAGVPPGYNSGGGGHGGDAIHTRVPIEIENHGIIAGGGGGGGAQLTHGYGGGGGAGAYWKEPILYGSPYAPGGPNVGWTPGSPAHGAPGSLMTGGAPGGPTGGAGGDLGEWGEEAPDSGGPFDDGTIGGAPGFAVDGVSFVTWIEQGDTRGRLQN